MSGTDKEHNADLYESSRYSVEQFDKYILFIASGAIAASFAFVKDIVKDLDNSIEKWSLITSWYIFAGVIFISLLGHFISGLAHNWSIKHARLKAEDFNKKIRIWNIWIRGFNIIMIIGVASGAFFLIYFIQQNL